MKGTVTAVAIMVLALGCGAALATPEHEGTTEWTLRHVRVCVVEEEKAATECPVDEISVYGEHKPREQAAGWGPARCLWEGRSIAKRFTTGRSRPGTGWKLAYEVACTPKGWVERRPERLWGA